MLAHWTPVRLYHAAAEVAARVALLQEVPIAPGGSGRIQLVLEQPIAAAVRDRFILRDTSGARTIGGGCFVDLRAPQRRRRVPARLAQLEALDHDDPGAALAMSLERWPFFMDLSAFARDRALAEEQIQMVLRAVPHVRLSVGSNMPSVIVRIIKPRESWVDDPEMRDRIAADGHAAITGVGL